MNKTAILTLTLVLTTAVVIAGAQEVYRTVDEDGNVTFSDVAPKDDSEPLDLQQPNTYIAPELPVLTEDELPLEDEEAAYESLSITTPANDEAVRNNTGNVTLAAAVEPALASNHQIQFTLDGTVVGTGPFLSLALTNIDRGTHIVQAHILDSDNRILKSSAASTFHMLRYSSLQGRP